jgi:polyisoprenoid-binding protein YceI
MSTTSAPAVQIPAVGTYQLDPAASTVKFATRHLFGLAAVKGTARGTSAPAELTITEAAASDDVLQIRAATRVDRYAHGLTKAKGLAGRHLDMEITARATHA